MGHSPDTSLSADSLLVVSRQKQGGGKGGFYCPLKRHMHACMRDGPIS